MNVNKQELAQIAQQHMGAAVQDMRYLGAGGSGKVWLANLSDGQCVILKVFRRSGEMQAEATQLQFIAQHCQAAMPRVLFTHSCGQHEVLGMTKVPGRNALDPRLLLRSRAKKAAFANDVAQNLLQLHGIRGQGYGNLQHPTHNSWLAYYNETIAQPTLSCLQAAAAQGKFSKRTVALLCEGYACYEQLAQEPEHAVLIHGDINLANIMADPNTLRLTGFIDPCEVIWAAREYGLFQLQNMWGNCYGLYDAYKAQHAMPPHSDFIIAFYGALNEARVFAVSGMHYGVWQQLWNRRLRAQLRRIK